MVSDHGLGNGVGVDPEIVTFGAPIEEELREASIERLQSLEGV